MKVAIISNQAFSLINFRGPLMVEMVSRGHEVLAFAPDFNADSKAAMQALGVEPVDCTMTRAGLNAFQELATIFGLWRTLRRVRPDLTFGIFLKPVAYSTIAAWFAGVPKRYGLVAGLGFAFGSDSDAAIRRRILRRLVACALRLANSRISHLAFQNRDDQSEALELGMVAPEKTTMIGATGVDLAKWQVTPPPKKLVTFILVARLLREKGIVEYIEAARTVRAKHPDVRFHLLGGLDNNPAAITRSEVEQWVAEGIIEWPGHVSVRPWLEAASVFVLPSYYREGVPRSTQEAMAIGRPVITTNSPGCRETVIDGRNGLLVPPRDPAALASAMLHFVDNPQAIEAMGKESRKLAESRFDIRAQNHKLISMMGL